jgi:hypothetical protein
MCPEAVTCVTGTMPTAGGATVDITGQYLGLQPGVVSLVFSGGSLGYAHHTHTITPGSCTVVVPNTRIQCPTVEGVGANYTLQAVVHGGLSNHSPNLLSFSPPVINVVDGPGAVNGPAAGGAEILLHGVSLRKLAHMFNLKSKHVPSAVLGPPLCP